MKIVALEEHFATAEVMRGWKSVDPLWSDLALELGSEVPVEEFINRVPVPSLCISRSQAVQNGGFCLVQVG